MSDKNNSEKNFNQELLDAIDRCSSTLSFEEISRLNGIRLDATKDYINKTV